MAEEELDPAQLVENRDKLKMPMRRDPKFIGRLISQLDQHMHKSMAEKRDRQAAVRADEAAIAKIDGVVAEHVTPNLERLSATLTEKQALRDAIAAQLERQQEETAGLRREVDALVARARHTGGKLMSKTASDRLREARGFSAAVPTTTLIKTKTPGKGTGSSS